MSDLMTFDDVVRLLRTSPARTREIMALPGFPADAPTSTPRRRLWLRVEVRAFKPNAKQALQDAKDAAAAAFLEKCAEVEMRSTANRRHHRAKRRTAEIQRTPPWADMGAIEAVYREAIRLESETGLEHDVDHVIPLQGRFVSGLHVAANLRAIPKKANASKGNRFEAGT